MSINSTWKSTTLFKNLEKKKNPCAEELKTFLKNPDLMDKIEEILNKGGTTPKDFTLHDGEHSFRVAERMWELMPNSTKKSLTEYEITFLLLSAYLHDIGMSPTFKKVELHLQYLTSLDKDILSETEINEFQKWIDNDGNIKSIDIRKEKVDDSKLSNYILAYYIRYKHNDWSGEWIIENLKEISLRNYIYWYDDLILICKSHHYGIENLLSDRFDLKPISANSKIHLRYLAICLRVADVMENDPERTPEVILKHRMISNDSLKYWLKDRRFNLVRNENKFTVYARPDKAYLHKAIEETANYVENELKLCDELIKLKPLAFSTFGNFDNYDWDIEPLLLKDIKPKENTYVYIQGGFRPNTTKILELLGGNQLYGNSIWAYRELIQNSYDAVKEKIAYQIINDMRNPEEFLGKLGDLFSINISLQKRDDGFWLVCKDQGVGMTKMIIEKFFLESGSSKRHEISELERRCKVSGFNFGRTGQFGIGVLSYFMIADKIIVKTKRELNTGYLDVDSIAWRFEINGAHDFGELAKYNKPINGTEIELRLKKDIENNIFEWDERFSKFLKQSVAKSPCNLSYNSALNQYKSQIEHGWTNSISDLKKRIIEILKKDTLPAKNSDNDFVSSTDEEIFLSKISLSKEIVAEVEDSMEFLFDEGKITDFGTYRIFIPFFKLTRGNCFYYLKEDIKAGEHFIRKCNKGFFWQPKAGDIAFSLKGMKIVGYCSPPELDSVLKKPILKSAYIELDIENINESCLRITRHSLLLEKDFAKYKKIIDEKVINLIEKNAGSFNNDYSTLNFKYTNVTPSNLFWGLTIPKSENECIWKQLHFPLSQKEFGEGLHRGGAYKGKEILFTQVLSDYSNSEKISFFDLFKCQFKPAYINNSFRTVVIPILLEQPTELKVKRGDFNLINLPKPLKTVVAFDGGYSFLRNQIFFLNSNSQWFKHYNFETYAKIYHLKFSEITLENLPDEKSCFAYLLIIIKRENEQKWIGLCEKREQLIKYIFKKLKTKEFSFLFCGDMTTVSFLSWKTERIIFNVDDKNWKDELSNNFIDINEYRANVI